MRKKSYSQSISLFAHDDLLPLHLKPQPNELLSSWLVRLAHAHRCKIEIFCASIFGRDITIWNRDIDKYAPIHVYERLSVVTGALYPSVINTTLYSFQGNLYEQLGTKNTSRWIIPLGVYHRTRNRLGLMYCPSCLKDDTKPYYRKQWRLAFSTVCTTHSIHLRDHCPDCQSPIIPFRFDMKSRSMIPNNRSIYLCWDCGFDLSDDAGCEKADNQLVDFQYQLELILDRGYTNWAGNTSMYALVYFDGLRALIAGIRTKESIKRLKTIFSKLTINIHPSSLVFEHLDLTQRREIMQFIAWLLQRWPDRYISLMKSNKLRYSDLKGDLVNRVYWYEDIIKTYSKRTTVSFTTKEIESITRFAETKYGYCDEKTAGLVTGKDMTALIRKKYVISFDVYESFLTSFDHEISVSDNEVERHCLLRDKIMFACAWVLGLTLNEVSTLTLHKLNVLIERTSLLSFYEATECDEKIKSWIHWYWINIRENYHPESEYVFISFYTKQRLKSSAISNRFNRAVTASGLSNYIINYNLWKKSNT